MYYEFKREEWRHGEEMLDKRKTKPPSIGKTPNLLAPRRCHRT